MPRRDDEEDSYEKAKMMPFILRSLVAQWIDDVVERAIISDKRRREDSIKNVRSNVGVGIAESVVGVSAYHRSHIDEGCIGSIGSHCLSVRIGCEVG